MGIKVNNYARKKEDWFQKTTTILLLIVLVLWALTVIMSSK